MKARGSLSAFMAFFVGAPAGLGLMLLINNGTIRLDPEIAHYVNHPVEMAEVVMFCCALGALLGKCLSNMNERAWPCGASCCPPGIASRTPSPRPARC